MSQSDSTAPPSNTDSSRALVVAGRDREEGAGDGRTAAAEDVEHRPVGLLDLADETLVHIYEVLLSLYPLRKDNELGRGRLVSSRYLLPLASILVNRRIYRVALPIRHRVLVLDNPKAVPPSEELQRHFFSPVRYLDVLNPGAWGAVVPLLAKMPSLVSELDSGRPPHLKHLTIEVETISSERSAEEGSYDYEEAIPDLLEFFQRVDSLEVLEFLRFKSLWWDDSTGYRLPSVRTLRLEELTATYFNPPGNHTSVIDFISIFPSLTTLHLSTGNLLSTSSADAISAAATEPLRPALPPLSSFLASEPELRDLLAGLQATKVLDFRYRTRSDSTVELRFSRAGAAAEVEFKGAWWWL
ncbi:hypothetical protein JCM6882_008187 [Rhodosporidiobolus microsporus]